MVVSRFPNGGLDVLILEWSTCMHLTVPTTPFASYENFSNVSSESELQSQVGCTSDNKLHHTCKSVTYLFNNFY